MQTLPLPTQLFEVYFVGHMALKIILSYFKIYLFDGVVQGVCCNLKKNFFFCSITISSEYSGVTVSCPVGCDWIHSVSGCWLEHWAVIYAIL